MSAPVDNPPPWREGEHRFDLGQQVLDATGQEIAWIRYNDPEVVDAMVLAAEMAQLLRDYLALTARVFGHQVPHDGSEVCLHCTNVAIQKRLDEARKVAADAALHP